MVTTQTPEVVENGGVTWGTEDRRKRNSRETEVFLESFTLRLGTEGTKVLLHV